MASPYPRISLQGKKVLDSIDSGSSVPQNRRESSPLPTWDDCKWSACPWPYYAIGTRAFLASVVSSKIVMYDRFSDRWQQRPNLGRPPLCHLLNCFTSGCFAGKKGVYSIYCSWLLAAYRSSLRFREPFCSAPFPFFDIPHHIVARYRPRSHTFTTWYTLLYGIFMTPLGNYGRYVHPSLAGHGSMSAYLLGIKISVWSISGRWTSK